MKRVLAYVLAWALALGVLIAPQAARATACSIPNTFTAGTAAVASQVNANFTSLQSCGNNIDHTNIGSSGIYASQIIPDTTAHATFGGSVAYTFSNGLTVGGGIVDSNVAGPDCLGIDSSHNIVAGASTQYCVHSVTTSGGGVTVSETNDNVTIGGAIGYNSVGGTAPLIIVWSQSLTASSCPNTPGACTLTTSMPLTVPNPGFTAYNTFSCNSTVEAAPYNGYSVLFENLSGNTGKQLDAVVYTLASGFGFSTNTTFTFEFSCIGY